MISRSRSSSPMKRSGSFRTPLGLKDSNVLRSSQPSSKSSSPSKTQPQQAPPLRYSRFTRLGNGSHSRSASPSKRMSPSRSASPTKKLHTGHAQGAKEAHESSFTIFQDEAPLLASEGQQPAQQPLLEDKENVAPFEKHSPLDNLENLTHIPQKLARKRHILGDLPITEYSGYIQLGSGGILKEKQQLTTSWMIHNDVTVTPQKRRRIVSYATPPKSAKSKYQYIESLDHHHTQAQIPLRRSRSDVNTCRRRIDFAVYNDHIAM